MARFVLLGCTLQRMLWWKLIIITFIIIILLAVRGCCTRCSMYVESGVMLESCCLNVLCPDLLWLEAAAELPNYVRWSLGFIAFYVYALPLFQQSVCKARRNWQRIQDNTLCDIAMPCGVWAACVNCGKMTLLLAVVNASRLSGSWVMLWCHWLLSTSASC